MKKIYIDSSFIRVLSGLIEEEKDRIHYGEELNNSYYNNLSQEEKSNLTKELRKIQKQLINS